MAYNIGTQRQEPTCKEKQKYLWLLVSRELEISGQNDFN